VRFTANLDCLGQGLQGRLGALLGGELGDELCGDGLGAEHGALRVGRADGLRATFVLPRQPRFFNHAANLVTPIRRIASGVW
jgi:hypothetical protein